VEKTKINEKEAEIGPIFLRFGGWKREALNQKQRWKEEINCGQSGDRDQNLLVTM